MVQFKVGDTVEMRASLNDFCGIDNMYEVRDINISLPPCSINTFTSECLNFSGINISFGWTNVSIAPALNVCPSMLKELGSATTNAQGVATRQYTITQNDLDLYNVNISSFDLAACITNSPIDVDNGIRRVFRSGDAITIISGKPTTHVLDLTISPYSWYTPQGAADYLVTNLVGINGAIVNWLEPLTVWTFLYTEIINDGTNIIIRIHLNDGSIQAPSMLSTSNIQTLAVQIGAAGIGILVITLGIIFITVGLIIGFTLIKVLTGTKDAAKQYTPEEAVKLVITDPDSIVFYQLKRCDTNFPSDAAGLKQCYDAIIVGAQDGLANKLNLPPPQTNTPKETQKCLDQYLIDSNWENYQTCLKAVWGKAGDELLGYVTTTEDCWISSPTGGCILTASTGKTITIIGGVVIGGYLIFRLIKK